MSMRLLRFVLPAALLAAAAFSVSGAAAGGSPPLPMEIGEVAEPVAAISETVETDARSVSDDALRHAVQPPVSRSTEEAAGSADVPEAAAPDAEVEAPPASRLLRSLDAWSAQPAAALPRLSPDAAAAVVGRTAAEAAIGGSPGSSHMPGSSPISGRSPGPARSAVLHGCPRALLASLLAEATETTDAVSALAIERETLALCRERQEIVNGIVALENELGELLAEAQGESGAPGTGAGASEAADAPVVKVPAPVRVIEVPTPTRLSAETTEAATAAPAPAPYSPAYSWFSIVGTAGDLRAGVSDGTGHGGTRGGTSVWFVREGDSLPGGVTVARIVARPPGVHVEGAVEGALPYSPRPSAVAGPRRDGEGDGS